MQLIAEKTVREYATEAPATIRVFEALGIDYCCGGKRTLRDACTTAGIEPERVLSLLALLDAPVAVTTTDWATQSLRALITHILDTHHTYVRREMPRILGLLAKVVARHAAQHPEVREIEEVFAALEQELSSHMFKEEQILFPYLNRLEQSVEKGGTLPSACFSTVEQPISMMLAEHDDAGALLARLRELSSGYQPPPGACPTYIGAYAGLADFERDLHQHIHLENNILFPRATALESSNSTVH